MKLKVTIDGKTYEVDVDESGKESEPESSPDEAPLLQSTVLRAASKPDSSPDVNESKTCRSPLAGVIVRSHVKPAQQVEVGELLMVLDAMKMETNITAPMAGTIKSVDVAPGEAVKADQILLRFE